MPRRPLLDQLCVRRDGVPVTYGELILEHLRVSNYLADAAQACGISKNTVGNWLAAGRAARAKQDAGRELNESESRYLGFLGSAEEAISSASSGLVECLHKEAWGGQENRITTTKTLANGDVEVTERVEYTRPNVAAASWLLERRHPKQWARRAIEVTGPGGGPIQVEDKARQLAEALGDFQAGVEAAQQEAHQASQT